MLAACSSCRPCEKFSRTALMPASRRAPMTSDSLDAGPSVPTILVLRMDARSLLYVSGLGVCESSKLFQANEIDVPKGICSPKQFSFGFIISRAVTFQEGKEHLLVGEGLDSNRRKDRVESRQSFDPSHAFVFGPRDPVRQLISSPTTRLVLVSGKTEGISTGRPLICRTT